MELKQGTRIMNAMVETSMLKQGRLVVKPAKVVDSVRRPLGKTASQAQKEPVLQEQSVDQSVKVESSQKDSLMKRVKEQSKYMVGLVILFVVTGLTLLLAGVFMLYLVAYMKNLGV